MEERGWRSGKSTKSRRRRHMWVEFVFGSLQYCSESFSHPPPGTPVSSLLKQLTLPNSNSTWNARTRLNKFLRTLQFYNLPVNTYPDGSSSNAKWMGFCPVLLSNRVLYETAFTVTAGKTCYYTERLLLCLQTWLFERHILRAKTLLF